MFRIPKNIAAFDEHYFGTHVELAKALPGLRNLEIRQGPNAMPPGAEEFHLMATFHFDSVDEANWAFDGPAGRATAADRRVLAPNPGDVLLFVFDGHEFFESDEARIEC